MKKIFILLACTLLLVELKAQRITVNVSENWRFGSSPDNAAIQPGFDDSSWESVDLPHTWNYLDGQDGGSNYVRSAFWYRKKYLFNPAWSAKQVFIRFGSANMKTDVYVNGEFAGTHTGGYAAFIFEITDLIRPGQDNTIAVKVDNSGTIESAPLSGDFTFFGGITREVNLIMTEKTFISPLDYASPGIYITPYNISPASAKINTRILLGNHYDKDTTIRLNAIIRDMDGAIADSGYADILLPRDTVIEVIQQQVITDPILWNGMNNAYLYKLEAKILIEGELKDEVCQPLGIREYSVEPDSGFYLNGRRYPLHGVAMHEDRNDKGRAVSDMDRKQDMELMHEMGCTFLRLAHYQHGEYTYDYCDTSGMVLWTEIPLVNRVSTSTLFTSNIKSQLAELIKQNYNHPSVFFWGLFNEINFQSGPDPAPLVNELNILAHELDSTRLTTAAAMYDERATHWIPDLISWNKYFGWYGGSYNDFGPWADWMHSSHSNSLPGVSEYGAGADYNDHLEDPPTTVHNSFFHPEEYQNILHEAIWQAIEERPFLWSSAIWVGFDFASDGRFEGIAPGINDKGMVSRDRALKKDAFYYYKANWSGDPFVYISSRRYSNRTDSLAEVKVYSNCDSVSLELNETKYRTLESGNHVFRWGDTKLDRDTNQIYVTGFKGQVICYDTCIWFHVQKEMGDTLFPGEIQINFQPASSPVPEGYLADDGSVYGDRGNGYTYGWNILNTDNARDRQSTDDPLMNTLNHLQRNGTYDWEIALDSGSYIVSIASGDPDYYDSYHVIEAEGIELIRGQHTAESMLTGTDTILVEDGRLTVEPGLESMNAKINLIHISPLPKDTSAVVQADNFHRPGAENILIFPNPATDLLNILLRTGMTEDYSLSIYNAVGQKVYENSGTMEKLSINTKYWQEGIYYIQLASGDQYPATVKIIKTGR